jgi:predicted permease
VSLLLRLRSWLRAVVRGRHLNRDIGEELAFHVDRYAEDLQRQGLSPAEALRRARAELGGLDARREECRESLGLRLFDELRGDLLYTLRTLRKAPGFAAATVVTLALGLGGSTAIFSAVDATVLRPLPYQSPDRLVVVGTEETTARVPRLSRVAPRDLAAWRLRTELFEQLAAYTPPAGLTLDASDGAPEELRTLAVSPEFFDVLRVRPFLGRAFSEDDIANSQHVAVISYDVWQTRFGGTPATIGWRISLQGQPYQVIGVMPPDFAFIEPSVPVFLLGPIQVYVPLAVPSPEPGQTQERYDAALWTVGRLAEGVSLSVAAERLNQLVSSSAADRPDWKDRRVQIVSLADRVIGGPTRQWMLLLLGAVALMLLIVCANVGSLLLARASVRAREVSIRAALGAGRWRIARQLLFESGALSVAGLAAGLLLAWWGIGVLRAAMPDTIPRAATMALDLRVLLAATVATAASALVCGILPALRGSRPNLRAVLTDAAHRASAGRSARRVRRALVVLEIAMAIVLLVGAGLFIGSFMRLMSVDLGYDPENVLTASVSQVGPGAAARVAPALVEVVDQLKTAPGVQYAAAISGTVPFARNPSTATVYFQTTDGREVRLWLSTVTADYHRALRIPLRMGRYLRQSDSGNTVAVLNQAAARLLFGNEHPVGQTLRLLGERQVVGVVADTSVGLEGAAPAVVFLPLGENPTPFGYVVVRTAADPMAMLPTVREAVQAALPGQAIREGRSLEDIHARQSAQRRLTMQLLTLFGALGLVIAAVGIYSVMAYIVTQQRREIGIRMALGATAAGVAGVFLRQAASVVVLGLAIGSTGAWMLSGAARPFLFQMEPTEPAVFAGALLVLSVSALAAGVVPARRAAAVDPSATLRSE